MAFQVVLSDEALRELNKLENRDAERILSRLEDAAKDPAHYLTRLAGREDYKLRAGDFRAIVMVFYRGERILIVSIGHRRNVYGKK